MNITMEPTVFLTTLSLVAGVSIFSFIKARHIEKMEMLDKDIPLVNSKRSYFEIKIGLFFIGIGVGVLLASILTNTILSQKNEIYPALIFLFGGLGLVASFFIIQNIQKK